MNAKRHIHFLVLSNIENDKQLIDLLKEIKFTETILVIEDIDCISDITKDRNMIDKNKEKIDETKDINKQSNIVVVVNSDQHAKEKHTNLTLSGLLNAIDGVFNHDGRILIMTTNHPEVLDDALVRPGRVDMKILFDNCDKQQIKELYEIYVEQKCPNGAIDQISDGKYSPAYISSIFLGHRDNPENSLKNFLDEK